MNIKIKKSRGVRGIRRGGGGGGGGGQGGCVRRIEVFVKIKKRKVGGRFDVYEELKFCDNKKEEKVGGPVGGGGGRGAGWNVNEELKL